MISESEITIFKTNPTNEVRAGESFIINSPRLTQQRRIVTSRDPRLRLQGWPKRWTQTQFLLFSIIEQFI